MINYGIAYGLSDFGLADRLKIPREDAQKFIADYFAAYEGSVATSSRSRSSRATRAS